MCFVSLLFLADPNEHRIDRTVDSRGQSSRERSDEFHLDEETEDEVHR